MGGKSSAPDMTQAAVVQGEANRDVVRDQTFANRPNQFTPFGATTWNPTAITDPATGEQTTSWQQVTSLTPQLQSILDKQFAIQEGRSDIAGGLTKRLGEEFSSSIDWRGLTPMGQVPTSQFTLPEEINRSLDISDAPSVGDPRALRARAEEAVYNQAARRVTDRFGQQREQMATRLRNQGLRPGDRAYDDQMNQLIQGENDALTSANYQAIQAGQGEQSLLFGQDMSRRQQAVGEAKDVTQFGNQAAQQAFNMANTANQQNFNQAMQGSAYANQLRQQQITEAMQKRGFTLNEINALLSGQQVGMPQMPNFSNATAAQPAPIYQAAADTASVNAASNPFGAILDAGSTLGAAAISNPAIFASDRRLKTNIKRIGTVKGYPWYSFDYIWGEKGQGVMSDEIPSKYVVDMGGYDAVNYSALLGD